MINVQKFCDGLHLLEFQPSKKKEGCLISSIKFGKRSIIVFPSYELENEKFIRTEAVYECKLSPMLKKSKQEGDEESSDSRPRSKNTRVHPKDIRGFIVTEAVLKYDKTKKSTISFVQNIYPAIKIVEFETMIDGEFIPELRFSAYDDTFETYSIRKKLKFLKNYSFEDIKDINEQYIKEVNKLKSHVRN